MSENKVEKKEVKKVANGKVPSKEQVKAKMPKKTWGERAILWLLPGRDTRENLKIWGKRVAKTAGAALLVGGAYALGKSASNRDDKECPIALPEAPVLTTEPESTTDEAPADK